MILTDDDRLRSENDSLLNDGIGAMFFDTSADLDGRHGLLSRPRIVWSSTEQQLAVNGRHGFDFDWFCRGVDEIEDEFGEFIADFC